MIVSRTNPKIKYLRSLRAPKKSREEGFYLAEGIRLLEEASHSPALIRQVFYSPRCEKNPRGVRLIKSLAQAGCPMVSISATIADAISETEHPQGILAIMRRVEVPEEEILSRPNFLGLLLHHIQDPGNIGSILRVAEASGVTGVLFSREGVDPFHSKVVRSSMGSLFRLPMATIRDSLDGLFSLCRQMGIQIVATAVGVKGFYDEIDYRVPTLLILGQEGAGLPGEVAGRADRSVSIPMKPPVDSLNVATAAGIILYEAARQRGLWKHPLIRR
jgi:TrmH family RNA methyltransferase